MNEPGGIGQDERSLTRPVFVSYATADRKEALSVCKAIERRGTDCWISTRDVAPGDNYQEAIVRALRSSRAMVLVFSEAANNSDEIKKELSLASRYRVPVMALRIEDVEPSDAFAYELSTRQWIDAFQSWDKSMDALVRQIGQLSGESINQSPVNTATRRARVSGGFRKSILALGGASLALLSLVGGLWLLKPRAAATHSLMVRLTGFQRLSTDLPQGLDGAVHDEIVAAFGDQGVIGLSTARAAPPGSAPAYALGGTIRRDGSQIRVITRLINERSGATLWSRSTNYDATELSRVPRRTAVDAARMARCGLFAASTYPKSLPDLVLADYIQYCGAVAVFGNEPEKGLIAARKVVAAAPDFSWGWSAVADAAVQSYFASDPGPQRDELRHLGLSAADKALALDAENSDALTQKSMLIDSSDRVGQERMLRQAIAARPLDCGCEHLIYGLMLENVGRYEAAVQEFRRAIDMLALDPTSEFALGDSLTVSGRPDEAKSHFQSAADLAPSANFADLIEVTQATETGNYAAGIRALENPKLPIPSQRKAALLAAYRAMASGNSAAKVEAVKTLLALPEAQRNYVVMRTVAVLGAPNEALGLFLKGIGSRWDWASVLWYPSMRAVLNEPSFPALADRLGLMTYWRHSHTKPDVCGTIAPPPFCRRI